ncbi:MAG: hypothetical protein AB7K09_05895 [Planctomycetota bacterium]
MRFLPHLVEVNEKYRSKGLEILMATDVDAAPALDAFVKEKKLTLGVARVADVYKTLKASGYPSSFAIDVDGNCIWRGHPQMLNDALVDTWLKDLRKPKIPRTLKGPVGKAVHYYDAGDYGKALEEATDLVKKDKDDEVKADATYIVDLLQGRMDMHKARAEAFRKQEYHDKLLDLLEADADEFKGTDFADSCDDEAKKVKRSTDYKKCCEARDELAKLEAKLDRMKPADAKKALEKLARTYKKYPYGARAQELADAINEDEKSSK